jgi:uracil-DNA glycosylase family 4
LLSKPITCTGCPLDSKGIGYAPASGPIEAEILIVGEALGRVEAAVGRPFSGPSGDLLDKILHRTRIDRQNVRVDNCVRCQPPNDWLDGAPWEAGAILHCSQYLGQTLAEKSRVVISLGASSTRRLLGLSKKGHKQGDWHGCVAQDPSGKFLVVPSFHPAFLLRGNQKLLGVSSFDFLRAKEVAEGKFRRDVPSLVVDPPIDWFRRWVGEYDSEAWLAVDIETPEKLSGADEGELEDESYTILRINLSYHPGQGITVPWEGQYIEVVRDLLGRASTQCYWNGRYDIPRLRAADVTFGDNVLLDFMWGWHVLQSDLPRGLGFVAPFYSTYGAWKHLSGSDPGAYAALDAVQTLRCAFGIARDLQAAGRWDAFYRHVWLLDSRVLWPSEQAGIGIDTVLLDGFGKDLEKKQKKILDEIQGLVPEHLKPLHPPGGWKREPKDRPGAFEIKQKDGSSRWFIREEFNPGSPKQLLDYIKAKGLTPGRTKKQEGPSTDKNTLERLAKGGDPLFKKVLEYREVDKVRGTYVEGVRSRLQDGRIHPQFTHAPSTMRLSSVHFNIQNVVKDDEDGEDALAAGFRRCIVASPGCSLVEADYSAIEAVETGWCIGDPSYIRLALLGIHDYVASHYLGLGADLSWSDEKLRDHFRMIKKRHKLEREMCKRVVHGTNYGMTSIGIANYYPEHFTRKKAEELQGLYFKLCPRLKTWQDSVRRRAHRDGQIGGKDHPFRYGHWFWNVFTYNRKINDWVLGEDSKRVVAFYPQSIAAGVLYEALLDLVDEENPDNILGLGPEITNGFPLRAPIHDSILGDVRDEVLDDYCKRIRRVMTAPIEEQTCPPEWGLGEHLSIGVEIKIGKNWMEMRGVA